MRVLLPFLLAAAAFAQGGIRPPILGCQLTVPGGNLRILNGFRHNVTALPIASRVIAAACSDRLTLYHTGEELIFSDGDRTGSLALRGRLLLAVEGLLAVALDLETGTLLYRDATEWHTSPFRIEGDVSAIRLVSGRLAVLRTGVLQELDVSTAAILHSVPFDVPPGPAILLPDSSILTIVEKRWLHCQPSGCAELAPAPANVLSLSLLTDNWIAVNTASGLPLAIRLREGALETFYLPGEPRE